MPELVLSRYLVEEIPRIVADASDRHEKWRLKECINLGASESVLSPTASKLLSSDTNRRVVGAKHRGARYVNEINAIVSELAKKLFHVEYVEYNFWGCSCANAVSIRCLTEVGDTVFALEEPRGHKTYREDGYSGHRGLKIADIPFDVEDFNIDIDELKRRSKGQRAKAMIVGTSTFIFPHPLKKLSQIAEELGAKILYDGAHVLGLIAGGRFQDPLGEGAYIMTASLQKTFSGPVGGIILHNDPALQKKIENLMPGYQGSVGFHLASLAVTLAEMTKFGGEFATQIINNAKSLASRFDREEFDVIGKHKGYTESHTVLVDVSRFGDARRIVDELEKANIICSAFQAKRDQPASLLRIGTTEITRYGMKESDVQKIVEFMKRIIVQKEDPTQVAEDVVEFRKRFLRVQYCFDI